MTLILGIDPGSRKTGYGIVSHLPGKLSYVCSGVIRMSPQADLAERLKTIYASLCEIIETYQPQEMAVEQVFMARNASSALKLGQARGAAIVAGVSHDLSVAEYEARKVKQSVVGTGAADKFQVQHMVKTLLGLPRAPQEDAADALAVALCHANTQHHLSRVSHARAFGERVASSRKFRRGRLI